MKTFTKYLLIILSIILASCSDNRQSERLFTHFLNRHVERIKPINKKYYEAVWATYSGKSSFSDLFDEARIADSLYKKAGEPVEFYQGLLNSVYDNSSEFELLLKIKQSGLIQDPLLKRQFVNVFRKYIMTKNDWRESDNKRAELYEQFFELKRTESAFWDSVKYAKNVDPNREWIQRFAVLTDEFRNMVIAMNHDAQRLGYDNYYQSVMDFNGVDYNSLDEICEIVEKETYNDYRKLLVISNLEICKEYGIQPYQIRPQHYKHSIREMMIPNSWQKEYTQEEVIDILKNYFALGDYELDDILKNSDLWYADGKIGQSFFISIDLEKKDNRVYADIKPNTIGVYTLLHEFGHALHYKYVDKNVPYMIREPHQITSEGLAIYFNNKLYISPVLKNMMGINEMPQSKYFQYFSCPSTLIYLRKLVRNIQFEKSIFENPSQDYNQLWWDLTKKYMLYNHVADADRLPEWISNQHIINASGIHVFYLYAFAFAAQLEHYYPDDKIAEIKSQIMKYGDSMDWNKILEQATGEPLNLNYLFNSYKWKNKQEIPISFDVKTPSGLSNLELKMFKALVDRELYTISS